MESELGMLGFSDQKSDGLLKDILACDEARAKVIRAQSLRWASRFQRTCRRLASHWDQQGGRWVLLAWAGG